MMLLGIFLTPAAIAWQDVESRGSGDTSAAPAVIWIEPTDLSARDLLNGPGGPEHRPGEVFAFEDEDTGGTNPKLVLRDDHGTKWKAKLGAEAKPETVATRLIWAAGYFADEDYFQPRIRVTGLPPHLKRGDDLRGPDGTFQNVRLRRDVKGEEKLDTWSWKKNPFVGTRELNGLRTLMALVNNWDCEDKNNALFYVKKLPATGQPATIYEVRDLGASFGAAGLNGNHKVDKGNLKSYGDSRFITKVDAETVDFGDPGRPALKVMFNVPEYVTRLHIEWIGQGVPRKDARWIGQLLMRLSPDQVRDAFRAADYDPKQIDGFSTALRERIAELAGL